MKRDELAITMSFLDCAGWLPRRISYEDREGVAENESRRGLSELTEVTMFFEMVVFALDGRGRASLHR